MVTLITRIFDIFMNRLFMSLYTTLCCSLMITLITRILDFFMNRLNMSLQTTLSCSLIITLITWILNFFMNSLNVRLQITLWWSLVSTLSTRIFDFDFSFRGKCDFPGVYSSFSSVFLFAGVYSYFHFSQGNGTASISIKTMVTLPFTPSTLEG